MATVVATYDTVNKTLSVSVDGADVPDVMLAEFYPAYEGSGFSCSVTTQSKDKQNDCRKMTRLVASKNGLDELSGREKARLDVQRHFAR